jgi:hypothetical protein
LKKFSIPGRAQLLGTPAEENGGGKAVLIDAGAYKNVDISLMAYDSPILCFSDNWMVLIMLIQYLVTLGPRSCSLTKSHPTESLVL